MVLPLMGLIGLGAAAGAKPHWDNYQSNVRGRRTSRLMDEAGLDPQTATPQQMADFGLRHGMLDFDQAVGVSENQRNFDRGVFESDRAHEWNQFKTGLNMRKGMDFSAIDGPFDAAALTSAHVDMESGNNYAALGPVIESGMHAGDQALGKYQVMPNTLAMWSNEVFGREVTPEEFMANPDLQDQLYYEKFIKVAEQEGMHNALSKWHSGLSYNEAVQKGVADQNMSTVDYVDSVIANYQRKAQANERKRVEDDMREVNPALHKDFVNPATPAIRKQQIYDEHFKSMQARTAIQAGNAPDPVREAINNFHVTQQPRADAIVDAAEAVDMVNEDLFKAYRMLEPEDQQSVDFINRILFAQRMECQKQEYGDAEPGPAIQEKMAEMFPLIEQTQVGKGKRAARIKQNLRTYLFEQQQALDAERENLARQGIQAPELVGQGSLPAGWSYPQ